MDSIYSHISPDEISWTLTDPLESPVHLVESGRVGPSEVVDLGCGERSSFSLLPLPGGSDAIRLIV